MNQDTSLHFAEYVSYGHPDRLADAVVEKIVAWAIRQNQRALVGVEVAVHDDEVFVDGRVAGVPLNSENATEQIDSLVRLVYQEAGYGKHWGPRPEDLKVKISTCIEELSEEEDEIRSLSDDQNIVLGFAEDSPETNYLPAVHWLANRIGRSLEAWRSHRVRDFGPDLKVLPILRRIENGSSTSWDWERLTVSLQHRKGIDYELQYRKLFPFLADTLSVLEKQSGLTGLSSTFGIEKFYLNGAGDFCQGGPQGDNGLSGKKLVVDHYGPAVPIGGGALCGKDPHKIDRVGPLRARQLAKRLCQAHCVPARVRLGWSPGEAEPFLVEAHLRHAGGWKELAANQLPPRDWFGIDVIFRDLDLGIVNWPKVALAGYFQNSDLSWER
ncbi:MAG: methionine adenosyltransferase domain-containing protein [Opitutae bacterium]|nr:methionine adenosyltransferase domain-containing protein [Opitutae bacterium]